MALRLVWPRCTSHHPALPGCGETPQSRCAAAQPAHSPSAPSGCTACNVTPPSIKGGGASGFPSMRILGNRTGAFVAVTMETRERSAEAQYEGQKEAADV
ncbi:hypothetical protein MHYP_G00348350 [Metynnis hypsauchen]